MRLPLTERLIPIIADDYVDPAFGSGCAARSRRDTTSTTTRSVAATSCRSSTSSTGREAVTDAAAELAAIPPELRGLDRYEARKRHRDARSAGARSRRSSRTRSPVPRGDRSGAVLEPWLTDQWYVKIAPLAEPAIRAVEDGSIALRSGELGQDLLSVDAQHPGLVHQPPALVGSPDSGLVRRLRATSS